METIKFEYPAKQPAAGRVLVGVVGSGDLEVLLEPGESGKTRVTVNTSVDGAASQWRALFDRLFATLPNAAAMNLELNDFGATPGVVRMRLEQAMELVKQQAGK
jgi:malonate decarboxylase delta subunit